MKTKTTVLAAMLLLVGAAPATRPAGPPAVGDPAADFTLDTLDARPVQLSALLKAGPVVVLELRGWVGYQCPICNKQVGAFIARADDFKAADATVVMVYPGPAVGLQQHAADFTAGKSLPANFRFVVDPELAFVDAWGLRWHKAGETAYPSTFIVDRGGVVRFAKVSHTHGNRASPSAVLDAVAKLK